MEDRFKFRVFETVTKKMVYSGDVWAPKGMHEHYPVRVSSEGIHFTPRSKKVAEITLFENDRKVQFYSDWECERVIRENCIRMQCTGQIDKNKILAYESDIVLGDFGSGVESPWVVTWNTVHGRTGFHAVNHRGQFGDYHGGLPGEMEVIGNIHEHAHLLED